MKPSDLGKSLDPSAEGRRPSQVQNIKHTIMISFLICFRKAIINLILDGEVFISEMESLEKALCSFLHICFVANIKYQVGSGMLYTFLQRCVAIPRGGNTTLLPLLPPGPGSERLCSPMEKELPPSPSFPHPTS
jgi:hypothetical protein